MYNHTDIYIAIIISSTGEQNPYIVDEFGHGLWN